MEKRMMGKTGVETSLLGYGCMRLPMNEEGKIDEEKAEALLDRAIAGGVNYIDAAYPYLNGQCEAFVGKVMQKYDRSKVHVATKLPLWNLQTVEDAEKIFAEQLQRLQTDHIEFYLMHAVNGETWKKMVEIGVVKRLEELKAEGKIINLGFSFHDKYEVFEEILNYRDWDFCQIQLNYMDVNIQAGMKGYDLTVEKDIPLVIMEPVKGGTLAAFADDITARFRELDSNASVASFALRWVASLPNVKVVLSGMGNSEMLEDNLKTFGNFRPMSEAELQTVTEIVELINSRVQNSCTGCSYCMPCPFGVDIPGTFRIWNTYHMYQNYNLVKRPWERREESKLPKNCKQCGKCESVCPQKIRIREDLARAQEDLDKKEMIV